MMSKQPDPISLEITDFSPEGHGRGTWCPAGGQPQQVEVPFTIPGDRVELGALKRKRRLYQGVPIVCQCSHDRVTPRCVHFGLCGGCRWQQVPYEAQLRQKEAWVRAYLESTLSPDVVFHPILPCEPPWYYRNKMELTFSSDKRGKRYLGLILYGTRGHVFQMQQCHLAPHWMVETVHAVSGWWSDIGLEAYQPHHDRGTLRTLIVREGVYTGDRMVMLTVSGNPAYALPRDALLRFVSTVRNAVEPRESDRKLSIFLRIQQIAKGKPTQFYEMLLHGPDHIREVLTIQAADGGSRAWQFRISPSAFFQPNTRQAERLYSRAIQMAPIPPGGIVYDLYCGTGTFGICMADRAKEVIGIELSPESSLDARENAKLNGLSNVTIHTGDVGCWLSTLLGDASLRPDLAIVDPPRAGLEPKALQNLLTLRSPQLVYVSCNPAAQAANLKILIEGGYSVRAVQPIDQFPHTVHVENIVALAL